MIMLKKLPTWLKIVLIINLIWLIFMILYNLWVYIENFKCGPIIPFLGSSSLENCYMWDFYMISLLGVIPLSIIIGIIVDRLLYLISFKSK